MTNNLAEPGSQAGAEANKELVKRYFDAMERGAVDESAEFWAPDSINHASGRHGQPPPRGRNGMAIVSRMLRTAFPDRRWEIDDMIAEGDKVVCRMTVSGTFGAVPERPPWKVPPGWVGVESTELVPTAAAGNAYSVHHIHIFRIANRQIAEHWAARDDLGLMLQLGAIVPPRD
jgi:predicted ester cyclase